MVLNILVVIRIKHNLGTVLTSRNRIYDLH